MHEVCLNAMTDVEALRTLVRTQLELIAQRDTAIARRNAEIEQRDAAIAHHLDAIAQRDAKIVQRDALIAERDQAIHLREQTIAKLNHEIARLRRVQFAARTERMNPDQRVLFDETMAADIAALEAHLETLQSPSTPAKSPRRTPIRRPLPAHLRREVVVHEPASCACSACGTALVKIGEHHSEKLEVVPMEFYVRQDVYPQYACRACESIVAEPVAPAVIDRGMAGPSVLAQLTIAKYVDHLPLYRQEAIFQRHGIELPRTTLSEWIGRIGVALEPLAHRLRERLLLHRILHADETPVQQLDPGSGKTQRAYLFAYRSGEGEPIVVFDYCQSRAGAHARNFLGHWRGALMVDDFAGYKALFDAGITELACWAHARRKFVEAPHPLADQAIVQIASIYAAWNQWREDRTQTELHAHLRRAIDAFHIWLTTHQSKVLGHSAMSKAIHYSLRRWPALARVADDDYPIDNNPIENAIRPIALGRKNWLFTGSATAGQRAASIMSLVATAKANGIEPYAWLTETLTQLPTTKNRDIDSLLPIR